MKNKHKNGNGEKIKKEKFADLYNRQMAVESHFRPK